MTSVWLGNTLVSWRYVGWEGWIPNRTKISRPACKGAFLLLIVFSERYKMFHCEPFSDWPKKSSILAFVGHMKQNFCWNFQSVLFYSKDKAVLSPHDKEESASKKSRSLWQYEETETLKSWDFQWFTSQNYAGLSWFRIESQEIVSKFSI